MIRWQPGYVYPPVWEPPHYALGPLHALFFVALALAVGVLAYRRPALGVGALIVCAPFAEARYLFGTSITVSKAALIGFVIALILHRTSLRVLGERPVRGLLLAFAAILGAIVLSSLHALHEDAVVREFLKWIEYGAVFAAVVVGFAYDPDDRPIWTALVAAGLFEVGAAVYELLFGAASGVVIGGHNLPRVAGTLEGPNQFAGWLNLLLPVLFARTLADRNPWLIATVTLGAIAEVATLSRSGIVAAVAAAAVVLIVTRPSRRIGIGFAVAAVVIAAVLVSLGLAIGLEARFFSVAEVPQPDHLGTRAILWTAAIDLWRTSPFIGVGAGNFEFDLGLVGHPEVHTHANSLYLQALSEMGLTGLAATLFLIWTAIATFARSFSRRPLLIGVFAANIALALHQVFDYLWFFPKVGIFWAILLAIGVVEVVAARDDVGRVAGRGVKRIAVIGTGYVGLVTGTCFAELGDTVICLDSDAAKIDLLNAGRAPFYEPQLPEMIARNRQAGRLAFSTGVSAGIRASEVIFIAVDTPAGPDGSTDLSAVRAVAASIGRALNGPKIVVSKSTVPVETGDLIASIIAENAVETHRVDVVSNPEFLREGSAVADFMHPDRIVIGTSSAEAEAAMRDVYRAFKAPVVVTDVRTSEMIKYAANAFLATKISFMNEIANICDLVGVDVTTIARGIGFDHRIGTEFMNPGIGYGGSCFPKDVRALQGIASARRYDAPLLQAVERVNGRQIDVTVTKIVAALDGDARGKTVCVWGLAFKPGTDDVRGAPALAVIERLLTAGARVRAHDPQAIASARRHLGDRVTLCDGMYDALEGCDALLLATEWDEYKHADFARVRAVMRGTAVIDGRNAVAPDAVAAAGLAYTGIGRSAADDYVKRVRK